MCDENTEDDAMQVQSNSLGKSVEGGASAWMAHSGVRLRSNRHIREWYSPPPPRIKKTPGFRETVFWFSVKPVTGLRFCGETVGALRYKTVKLALANSFANWTDIYTRNI